ncbi:MAG: hypothetical protein ACK5MK_11750 [Dysgonomonas sp.]
MRKERKKENRTITVADYIKAVKKADRNIQLEKNNGWTAVNKIHKSKKTYTRKNNRKNYPEE